MPALSYKTIQKRIARLQAQARKIERARATTKRRAVARVRKLMAKLGLTLGDLSAVRAAAAAPAQKKRAKPVKRAAAKPGRKTRKVPIKYRGPKRGDTWTGRGKTPRWMAALIADGKKKEDFLIKG